MSQTLKMQKERGEGSASCLPEAALHWRWRGRAGPVLGFLGWRWKHRAAGRTLLRELAGSALAPLLASVGFACRGLNDLS